MSGVNLDALSEEQLDALIAGCRALRALRAPYVEDKVEANRMPPALEPDAMGSTDQAVMPLVRSEEQASRMGKAERAHQPDPVTVKVR